MKKISLFTAMAAGVMLAVCSCSDVVNYNDDWDPGTTSDGPPVIAKIAAATDEEANPITEGALNQVISIWGDNLTDLVSVFINDVEVSLLQTYAVRERLNLQIPRVLPGEIDNKVKVTTKRGYAEATLDVVLPDLHVEGFYNEFTPDLDTVKVIGKEFDLYKLTKEDAVVKLNGTELPIIEAEETSFSIKIPAGTPNNSTLTIESPEVATTISIPFRQKGVDVLTDANYEWDNQNWFNVAWGRMVDREDDPESPFQKYLYFAYNWNNDGYAGWWSMLYAYWDLQTQDIIDNPEKYLMKFEIKNKATLPLEKNFYFGYEDTHWKWNPETYYNDGLSLNTMDEWKTITLELTDVYPKDQASTDGGFKSGLKTLGRTQFRMSHQGEQILDIDGWCAWNFRIVPKQ